MGKESTRLTLRWDNFQANLQDTWRQLHQSEDFADVILACDVGQVMAHKVVLGSCSPYLHSILMRLRQSHQQPVIFLSRINITNLAKLVTFMYCGQVDVEESQLESFLQAAGELQVKGLVATGANSFQPDATTVAKGVNDAKSASKGSKVTKKTSSMTSNGGDTLKVVAEKALSKERSISPLDLSRRQDQMQSCSSSFSGISPSKDEGKGAMVKVEHEEVVEVEAADEIRSVKASPFAEAKSAFGADASVVEIADVVCQCGLVKIVRTVNKKSENKGRAFFTCPKKLKPCTGSFQWCDQVAPTLQGSESSGGTQAFELNQDIGSMVGKEIKEIEIIDANGERIAPAKLNNNLQTMYQRLQAGRFQCNNCGKVLSSRQKIMVHLETHLRLSLPCSLCTNLSKTRKSLANHYQTKHALSVNPLIL